MQSKAATVEQYLAELEPERAAVVSAVREVMNRNLDKGFAEAMDYGMIAWSVPHSIYPAGYHCDPSKGVMFAALAAQKGGYSLYLMSLYQDGGLLDEFKREWAKAGKKLDMGKSCIRFKKLEDLPLAVVGKIAKRVSVKQYIARYQAILDTRKPIARKKVTKAAAKKVVKKSGRKPSPKAARK